MATGIPELAVVTGRSEVVLDCRWEHENKLEMCKLDHRPTGQKPIKEG